MITRSFLGFAGTISPQWEEEWMGWGGQRLTALWRGDWDGKGIHRAPSKGKQEGQESPRWFFLWGLGMLSAWRSGSFLKGRCQEEGRGWNIWSEGHTEGTWTEHVWGWASCPNCHRWEQEGDTRPPLCSWNTSALDYTEEFGCQGTNLNSPWL